MLEALPALRRWLLRARPVRPRPNGHRPHPLPLSHVRVFIHLSQYGPLTMGELARGLGISCATTTECVAALEAAGRVARTRSLEDRRHVVVKLTPEAEHMASQILSQRRAVVEEVLQQLPPQDRRAFVQGLSLLARAAESRVHHLSSLDEQAPPPEQEGVTA